MPEHEQDADSSVDTAPAGQPQQHKSPTLSGHPNFVLPQVPHVAFIPFQVPNSSLTHGERWAADPNIAGSQMENQERFLEGQIEVNCLKISLFFSYISFLVSAGLVVMI